MLTRMNRYYLALASVCILAGCIPIVDRGDGGATIPPNVTPIVIMETAPPSPIPTNNDTATPTPRPTVTALPPLTAFPDIIEVTAQDRYALAALCWVETRGVMQGNAITACWSVMSTVLTRAAYRLMSDGTITGTLGWGCLPDSEWCQFPAYVIYYDSCDGVILALCPANSPSEVDSFKEAVDAYFDRGFRGNCDGYLFYGIKDFDPPECVEEDDLGHYINFHGRPTP